MALTTDGTNTTMLVTPTGSNCMNGGCGDGFGWGGNGAWWLLVLFLFAFNGNGGWGGNFGGNGAMPYIMNSTTNNDVQRGFDQQAVMTGIGDLNGAVTSGFAGVNQAVSSGFANAEISNNARQIADMQQAFASQTAITGGMNGLQSQLAQCCCDNRLATANLNSTILAENCADRAALSDGIRDLLVNQTANTQRLVDTTNQAVQGVYNKICQLELDAKNDRIAELQAELARARSDASQNAQTQALMADNLRQTQALEQYLNPAPIPAYVVQNPNCCANVGYNNCGCGVA
jgi:hypothetical protein